MIEIAKLAPRTRDATSIASLEWPKTELRVVLWWAE